MEESFAEGCVLNALAAQKKRRMQTSRWGRGGARLIEDLLSKANSKGRRSTGLPLKTLEEYSHLYEREGKAPDQCYVTALNVIAKAYWAFGVEYKVSALKRDRPRWRNTATYIDRLFGSDDGSNRRSVGSIRKAAKSTKPADAPLPDDAWKCLCEVLPEWGTPRPARVRNVLF